MRLISSLSYTSGTGDLMTRHRITEETLVEFLHGFHVHGKVKVVIEDQSDIDDLTGFPEVDFVFLINVVRQHLDFRGTFSHRTALYFENCKDSVFTTGYRNTYIDDCRDCVFISQQAIISNSRCTVQFPSEHWITTDCPVFCNYHEDTFLIVSENGKLVNPVTGNVHEETLCSNVKNVVTNNSSEDIMKFPGTLIGPIVPYPKVRVYHYNSWDCKTQKIDCDELVITRQTINVLDLMQREFNVVKLTLECSAEEYGCSLNLILDCIRPQKYSIE